jgi:uncharacterized protein YpmB
MVAIILSIIAMVASSVAIVISLKKQTVKVTKETTKVVEHAPAEHPFYYNEKEKTYQLDGNLKVTGAVSCMEMKKEE